MKELLEAAKTSCDILVSLREKNHLETKDELLLSSDDDNEDDVNLWRMSHL